ncbi:DUF3140 domain-containing protein [Solwaraspora sp. WMMD406]|uniref:DUF3140 domain-containing protein n=1 Tax=Solwaraspora sp. WMMD406 TaxID=3016095 RepID=UPI002415E6A9|nr:DUF3140 domain-containing protein [Solwaraspora sp. WMMD406]MDG4766266.1 DUF3140 domain-containing protein [Solwaraspora sp. WMMD406]
MAAHRRTDTDVDTLWNDFHSCVNMTSEQLRDWLLTEASGEVAYAGTGEGVGVELPQPGGAVLAVLGKRRVDLTDADRRIMAEVVDQIRTLRRRRPARGASDDQWRHALLDLGHDPLRDSGVDTAG